MTTRDPLQCTFEDASLNQLRDGIALSTAAKVDFFEEMSAFARHFGAYDRNVMPGGHTGLGVAEQAPAMLALVAVEPRGGTRLLLRFSDGAWGVFDFKAFVDAATEMTAPLADADFFARHFIEAGALAWPNGFDLSALSLHQRLEASGGLQLPG